MTTKRYRVGIYAAGDTAAATDRSLDALRAWSDDHSGGDVVEEDFDVAGVRDDLKRLFADVERDCLDVVLFPSLQGFLPMGARETVRHLAQLIRLGVAFASRAEPSFSTLGPEQEFLAPALLALEAQERHQISLRLRRGHARARRRGAGGRPRVSRKTRSAIARLRGQGKTIAEIAETLDVAPSTVAKYQNRSVDDLFELVPERAMRALNDPSDD